MTHLDPVIIATTEEDLEAARRWFGDRLGGAFLEALAQFRAEARIDAEDACEKHIVQILRDLKSSIDAALMARDWQYRQEQNKPPSSLNETTLPLPTQKKPQQPTPGTTILDALRMAGKSMTRDELAEATGLKSKTVSPHLSILKKAGKVMHDPLTRLWTCSLEEDQPELRT